MNRRGFLVTAPAIWADGAVFWSGKLSPPYPTPDRAAYPAEIKPKRHS